MKKIKTLFVVIAAVSMANCFTTNMFRSARVLGTNTEGDNASNFSLGGGVGFADGDNGTGTRSTWLYSYTIDALFEAALIPHALELDIRAYVQHYTGSFVGGVGAGIKFPWAQTDLFALSSHLGVQVSLPYPIPTVTTALLSTWSLSPDLDLTVAVPAFIPLGLNIIESGVNISIDLGKNFGFCPEIGISTRINFSTYNTFPILLHAGISFRFGSKG